MVDPADEPGRRLPSGRCLVCGHYRCAGELGAPRLRPDAECAVLRLVFAERYRLRFPLGRCDGCPTCGPPPRQAPEGR